MSTDEIIATLEKFDSILSIGDIFSSIFRQLGWWIIRLLSGLLDSLSSGQKEILKMVSFYNSPEFISFLAKYNTLLTGLGTIAVMFLALKMAKANNADRKGSASKYADNVLIAILLTVGLPAIIGLMVGVFVPASNESLDTSASSIEIYKSNITDIYGIDKKEWAGIETINDIKKENDLKYVDITELVDTGGVFFDNSPLSGNGKEILGKKLSSVDGTPTLSKLQSHWFTKDEAYFRYSWHPFLIMVELVIRNVVAVFVLFKIAQMGLELAVVSGILKVSAWTDLENGKRNRDLFIKVRNILIVLYLTIVMQSVFSLFCAFMKTSNLKPVITLVAMAAGCLLTIAGPSTIEQIFGVDAGVGSGFGSTLMGLGQASRMAGGVVGAGKSLASSAVGAAKNVGKGASYAGSATAGALSGFKKKSGAPKDSPNPPSTSPSNPPSGGEQDNPPSLNPSGGGNGGGDSSPTPMGNEPDKTPLDKSTTPNRPNEQSPLGNKKGENDSPRTPPISEKNTKEPTETTPLGQQPNGSAPVQIQPSSGGKESEYAPTNTDTLGSVVKGNTRRALDHSKNSSFAQKNKRVYQVSKNTTSALRNRPKKEGGTK